MTSEQPPSPPPARPPPPPTPTSVSDLGDDLLRLPSLPSLVRAALTCRAFLHAVRSSPAFRRRFRAVHPPLLLGLFFDPDGPAIPSFSPLRRRSDPDLAAAVRGADFFLTRLPDGEGGSPGWVISDCRHGYVLLFNCSAEQFAAYNPLTLALDLFPPPPEEIFDDCRGYATYLDCYVLSSEEGDGPFQVVYTCHDESRSRAAVFSSDCREWRIFPWSEAVTPQSGDKYWLKAGTMVSGFVYWVHTDEAYMLVLDTGTLQFSQMDLPPCLKGKGHIFGVGETKDGKLCIVCAIEFTLFVWFWRANGDGVESWMLEKMFPLEKIVEVTEVSLEEHGELKVVAIIGGFVCFPTCETFNDAHFPCWFLSLCLETAELDKLFQKRYGSHVCPYITAWSPSLVCNKNKVHPQLEGS